MKKKLIKRIIISFLVALLCYGIIVLIYKKINSNYEDLVSIEGNGSLIDDALNLEDSGITGEEYTIDTTYNPYYNFLNIEEKFLYKQIYANAISLKMTFKTISEVDYSNINQVIEAVTNDHPELFWLDNNFSYKYTQDNIVRQVTLSFNDLAQNYEENKKIFEEKANDIINEALKLDSAYDKELFVHNTLINNIAYDLSAKYNQTAYSALVNKSTVCAGYSKAFQYIMNKLGIVTYYVVGTSQGENHSWNIVKLEDGYYNVDLTWDATGNNHYAFFNVSDKQFSKTHTRGEFSSNLPLCEVSTYKKINNDSNDNSSSSNYSDNSNSSSVNKIDKTVETNKSSTNSDTSNNNVSNDLEDVSTDDIEEYEEETVENSEEDVVEQEKNKRTSKEKYRWTIRRNNQ